MHRLSVALFFLISNLCYGQHLKDVRFGTEQSLDIVTWNIERFPKAGINTMDSVALIIEKLDAEIIALQEIDDTIKFKEAISDLSDYKSYFKSNFYAGLGFVYNTSKVEVLKSYEILYTPQYWRPFPRSPLIFEIKYEGEKYILINNHFKCCGDAILDINNPDDQETRRLEASNLLKQYIDENFSEEKVILLGDLNDLLDDEPEHNVFQAFIDDHENYLFTDMGIAIDGPENWSYPLWPSHLDHILISNALFELNLNPLSNTETILLDNYFINGLFEYDAWISDHRPVGIRLYEESISTVLDSDGTPKIKIWPNPTNNAIKFQLQKGMNIKSMSIYNSIGSPVSHYTYFQLGTNTVNLTSFPSGFYSACFIYSDLTQECLPFVKF